MPLCLPLSMTTIFILFPLLSILPFQHGRVLTVPTRQPLFPTVCSCGPPTMHFCRGEKLCHQRSQHYRKRARGSFRQGSVRELWESHGSSECSGRGHGLHPKSGLSCREHLVPLLLLFICLCLLEMEKERERVFHLPRRLQQPMLGQALPKSQKCHMISHTSDRDPRT